MLSCELEVCLSILGMLQAWSQECLVYSCNPVHICISSSFWNGTWIAEFRSVCLVQRKIHPKQGVHRKLHDACCSPVEHVPELTLVQPVVDPHVTIAGGVVACLDVPARIYPDQELPCAFAAQLWMMHNQRFAYRYVLKHARSIIAFL